MGSPPEMPGKSEGQEPSASSNEHWESVYRTRDADSVSWFQPKPEVSLRLMEAAGIERDAAIIDVGGGASSLVDHLVEAGFGDLTILDISASALRTSRTRLGRPGRPVEWIESDVLKFQPRRAYDLWHDRALFHFMTGDRQRRAYRSVLERCIEPGGQAIIATFALDGPERCSGLPVRRYDADRLLETLGGSFSLTAEEREHHLTPGGALQSFHYFLLRRT